MVHARPAARAPSEQRDPLLALFKEAGMVHGSPVPTHRLAGLVDETRRTPRYSFVRRRREDEGGQPAGQPRPAGGTPPSTRPGTMLFVALRRYCVHLG